MQRNIFLFILYENVRASSHGSQKVLKHNKSYQYL